MWTRHKGVSTRVKYMLCSQLDMFSYPTRNKFVMTYMNAKLFREYSTALGWTLRLFSPQPGIFDRHMTYGYLIHRRKVVLIQILTVPHELSVNVTRLTTITTSVAPFSVLVSKPTCFFYVTHTPAYVSTNVCHIKQMWRQ